MGAAPPRIILVEEDAAVRAALRFLLELQGYVVETYESAEALAGQGDMIPANDCLVADYRLPGIDGLSLLMILRDLGIDMPAVIVASDPGERLRERAKMLGAAVVEKPLLSDDLSNAIRSALSGRNWPAPRERAA